MAWSRARSSELMFAVLKAISSARPSTNIWIMMKMLANCANTSWAA